MRRTTTGSDRESDARDRQHTDDDAATGHGQATASLQRAVGNQAVQAAANDGTVGSSAGGATPETGRNAESENGRVAQPETGRPPGYEAAAADGATIQRSTSPGSGSGSASTGRDPTSGLCPRCTRRYRAGKPLGCADCEATLQAKLTVSRPSDPAEREAERVADEVVRRETERGRDDAHTDPGGPQIRRSAGQNTAGSTSSGARGLSGSATAGPSRGDAGGSTVSSDVERGIESLRGGGRRLPESTQSFFEERFGRDFSDVRVHTGGRADSLARSVDARAFTTGRDVVFRSGEYQPESGVGRRLLAHELTHVVQQGGGATSLRGGGATTAVQRQEARMTSADLTSPRFEEQATLERVYDGKKILRRGDEGPAVFRVQQALVDAGFPLSQFGVDSIYGDETAAAVMQFQSEHGLQVDGVVGHETMRALDLRYPEPAAPTTPGGQSPASYYWSRECLLDMFCEWNEAAIEDLRSGEISLRTFQSAHVKMWKYDGNEWVRDRMYARGYAKPWDNEIGLYEHLSCYEAATGLYQEWFHIQQPSGLTTRQKEGRAWRAHESWLLAQGMFATESGFRERDPDTGRMELDVSAVYDHVESEYYGASGAGESVIKHDPDSEETKVEDTQTGQTSWRAPKKGDKYAYDDEIQGGTPVDTSDWRCAGF